MWCGVGSSSRRAGIATATRLERVLVPSEARALLVVLDLRELTFMDSCGAGVIASASTRARSAGGRLVLVCAPSRANACWGLTGVAETVEIVELGDSEPAIQALLHFPRAEQEHDWR